MRSQVSVHELTLAANKHAHRREDREGVRNGHQRFQQARRDGHVGRRESAAADGSQIDTWEDNLLAETSIRYGGYGEITPATGSKTGIACIEVSQSSRQKLRDQLTKRAGHRGLRCVHRTGSDKGASMTHITAAMAKLGVLKGCGTISPSVASCELIWRRSAYAIAPSPSTANACRKALSLWIMRTSMGGSFWIRKTDHRDRLLDLPLPYDGTP